MCFKEVSRVFQKSFKGVKINESSNGVLSGHQGWLKDAQLVFEESFEGVSRLFQGIFKGVSRKSGVQGNFKGI